MWINSSLNVIKNLGGKEAINSTTVPFFMARGLSCARRRSGAPGRYQPVGNKEGRGGAFVVSDPHAVRQASALINREQRLALALLRREKITEYTQGQNLFLLGACTS